MSDNFKDYMKALSYCKKYDLDFLCPQISPFIIAESLLRAYKDGAIQPADAADGEGRCPNCGIDISSYWDVVQKKRNSVHHR